MASKILTRYSASALDHAVVFSDDWVTPPAPQPKKSRRPAAASARLTPLCHAQSQTDRSFSPKTRSPPGPRCRVAI